MSRFSKLRRKLAARGARDPGGLAATIGRRKYSSAGFAAMAAKGRRRGRRRPRRSH